MGSRDSHAINRTKLIALAAALVLAMSIPVAFPGPPARSPILRWARPGCSPVSRTPVRAAGSWWTGTRSGRRPSGFMDPEVDQWPVWAYDRRTGREKVDKTFSIARPGPAIMALRGMARDAQGRLYLVDMNGRVMRTTVAEPGWHARP